MIHKNSLTPAELKSKMIKLAAKNSRDKFFSHRPMLADFRTCLPGYKQRAGEFKGKNWYFDPQTLEARSYRWWPMLTVIKGVLVRNSCNYSNSTSKHQGKLWRILRDLGIKADVEISVRSSVNNLTAVKEELLFNWARAAIKNKYSRKPVSGILPELRAMASVEVLGIRYSKKSMKQALKDAEQDRRDRLYHARERRIALGRMAQPVRKPEVMPPLLTLVGG